VFVSIINFFTAVLSGFVVFAILGFLAKRMNVEIDDVMNSGPGLAFVTYPEAVLHIPFPQVWAILFFTMMFVLGIGSQFGGIEAINTAIIDHWPHLRQNQWRVTLGTCLACFIAGLPMTCSGGVYLFTLLEWHTASWAILLIGFAEIIVLSWVYGIDRILENVKEMDINLSGVVKVYWKVILVVVTPLSCLGVFVYTINDMDNLSYRDYVFPKWADTLGWFVGFLTLVPMIISIAIPFLSFGSKMVRVLNIING
jgi:solute carrier family 6 (neurotransmitter transporter, glycine) member 5/9